MLFAGGQPPFARWRLRRLVPLLLGVLLISLVAGIAWGATAIDFRAVLEAPLVRLGLIEAPTLGAGQDRIAWDLRYPRALLAVLVGGGLAVTGVILQALTRNPLADPYLFGASSGAALGAVAVISHLGMVLGPQTLQIAAFAGAAAALLAVVWIASRAGLLSADRLILTGVAISFVFMAGTNLLIFLGDQRAAHAVVFWMLGGLGLARWDQLWLPALVVGAAAIVAQLLASRLDALSLGDDSARTLGIHVGRLRLGLFLVCALVTGTLVALSGAIGFVGLMVPHIVRGLVGSDHRRLVPLSLLVGAVFLVWMDLAARGLFAPQELAIGILTGAAGGLFFVALLMRR